LAAIDEDIVSMEEVLARASPSGGGRPVANPFPTNRLPVQVDHTPPTSFQPSKPVRLEMKVDDRAVNSVQLRYRHVNQAERYGAAEMTREGDTFHATIPAAYTDSPYPLQYFFVVRSGGGGARKAALYPGLATDLANQPYFLVRQDRASSGS